MDVLDLDWSPRGYLASGSIDNKILIWDVPSLKRKLNESAPDRKTALSIIAYRQCLRPYRH